MDDIKLKLEVDPLALPESDTNVKECLSRHENLVLDHVDGVKMECEDPSYDVTPDLKCEIFPVPISFSAMKTEPEDESCDVSIIKEEMLDVKTEDDGFPNRLVQLRCHDDVRVEESNCCKISVQHSFSSDCKQGDNMHSDEECGPPANSSRDNQLEFEFYDKDFTTQQNLTELGRNDLEVDSLKCDSCGNSFKDKNILVEHTKEKVYQHDSSVKCSSKPQNRELTQSDTKSFKCDICDKTFRHKYLLISHNSIHTGEKPHKCDFCEKSFRHKPNLVEHTLTHTGEKPHKCDVCSKSFRQRATLLAHILTHTGEKPYKCEICEHTFRQRGTLLGHTLTHTGEKPYKCDVCEKSFRVRKHLLEHKLIHSGVKPHNCDVCDKTFRHRSSLIRHSATHPGDKRYKCDVCDKTFRHRSSLSRHSSTHSEDERYNCDDCEKYFTDQKKLLAHTLTHSND
ncbi:zinc finger protein 836-like isoform X5 [Periplaneta americana]|uniref:zinc finger protein 836-like isoform X5 n=1 Tax=Periplaneta americana TaxID=6978 RepID=UPI0037E7C718